MLKTLRNAAAVVLDEVVITEFYCVAERLKIVRTHTEQQWWIVRWIVTIILSKWSALRKLSRYGYYAIEVNTSI